MFKQRTFSNFLRRSAKDNLIENYIQFSNGLQKKIEIICGIVAHVPLSEGEKEKDGQIVYRHSSIRPIL